MIVLRKTKGTILDLRKKQKALKKKEKSRSEKKERTSMKNSRYFAVAGAVACGLLSILGVIHGNVAMEITFVSAALYLGLSLCGKRARSR